MRLAINTFVYESGDIAVTKALRSARGHGFEYIDLVAYHSGDPTLMSQGQRRDVVHVFKDLGLTCSQLLLINTQNIASGDASLRNSTLDYMKKCADLQLELGGKQVLVCWGCGVYEEKTIREEAWVNSAMTIRDYARWGLDKGILVDLEMDPHVYFLVNNLERMAKMIEDVEMPNVFPNIDIGHLCITRESPRTLEKVESRILHVHLSETDSFAHTNSIIGTGVVDFRSYIEKVIQLGIEENCKKYAETAVAGIEMGEPGRNVDNPDRWIRESVRYLSGVLPELVP